MRWSPRAVLIASLSARVTPHPRMPDCNDASSAACSPTLSGTPYQVAAPTNKQRHQDKVSLTERDCCARLDGCIPVEVDNVIAIIAQEFAAAALKSLAVANTQLNDSLNMDNVRCAKDESCNIVCHNSIDSPSSAEHRQLCLRIFRRLLTQVSTGLQQTQKLLTICV